MSLRFSLTLLALFFLPLLIQAQGLPVIDFFRVDNNVLDYDNVERGTESANFSWQASGLRSGDSMQMHAWVGGAWGLIGEGFEPAKTDTLVIAHPLSYELPRYRLSVVDSAGQIVAENTLQLNYAAPADLPIINYFLTRAYDVTPEVIQNEEGIAIHWNVLNRWHRSAIYFQQVFSDGTVIDIADNNVNEWRRATDEGFLYPEYPGDGQDVVLRLHIVNIDTGETLAQRDTVLPIIRRDIPPAEVLEFSVTPTIGRRGGTATLRWNVSNATRVFIGQRNPGPLSRMCHKNRGYLADIIHENLPPSGSLEIQIPEEVTGALRFQIVADRYLVGENGCEPQQMLDEIFLPLENYTGTSPIVRSVGMNPSFVALAGDTLSLNWDVAEGQSILIEQGSGYGGFVMQSFGDLPLSGSLEIQIPNTAAIRIDRHIWVSVKLLSAGNPQPLEIFYDTVAIDPDDSLNCSSYVQTDPPMISPLVQNQQVTVTWDGCGLDNLFLRTIAEDPNANYTLIRDYSQAVASTGSFATNAPSQEAVMRFILYRLVDGQEVEIQRASIYVEPQ